MKGGNSVGILLSDLLACRELEEFEGEEEEDVKADPIHDIDICEYVTRSMKSVSQTQIAQVLSPISHFFTPYIHLKFVRELIKLSKSYCSEQNIHLLFQQ